MMFPIKNRTFEQILGFSISEMYYFSPRPTVKRDRVSAFNKSARNLCCADWQTTTTSLFEESRAS